MARNTEKKETDRFVDDLHEHFKQYGDGVFTHKVHGSVFSSGMPDLLAVVLGFPWFVEFKIKGNKPTAKQESTMNRLASAGALVGLCTIEVVEKGLKWAMTFDVMDEDGTLHRIAEQSRRRGQTWNLQFMYEFPLRIVRNESDWR